MSEVTRIGIIDDHPIFLSGLKRAFQDADELLVVAEGADKEAAIEMARPQDVDLMLVDIGIPGGGIEATREILKKHPHMKVIMLTGSDNEEDLETCITLGAQGYLLKGADVKELREAISAVLGGEQYISAKLAARYLFRQLRQGRWNMLTPIEHEIAGLVSEGLSNREIAAKLNQPIGRIKNHMTRILCKLGARNRIEVIRAQV